MYNMKRGEDTEQIGVIEWANWNRNRYPELELLFHVPNGGKRSATEAGRFKAMGVKAGVPDLILPVPRGGHAGLFIEMKYGSNKTTTLQDWWLSQMIRQGYKATVCYSGTEATAVLEEYLQEPQTILSDPRKAKPEKRVAIYCKSEDRKEIIDTLKMAVTDGSCIFAAKFEPCRFSETNNSKIYCADCIEQNVEFHEYD